MIRIQRLKRPTKKSGFQLKQGETTEMRGFTITNVKAGNNIYVDKFMSPIPPRKKKKKTVKRK